MSFSEAIKQAEKEGKIGSSVFKPQEGKNTVRVVAGPLAHEEEYEGKPRFKWLVAVIDRKDGLVKPWFMPLSIAKMIRDLQESDDFAFQRSVDEPLPYDIVLSAKNAGTRDVEYGVVPRKTAPLTREETIDVADFGSLADYQQRLRERRGEKFDPDAVSHDGETAV